MKVLIIASEEWNDCVYSNNVLTNWFTDFPAEFAEIYTSPGLPINNICDKYFQITESQMVKSIFGGSKAGGEIVKPCNEFEVAQSKINARRQGIYGLFKQISLYINTPVVLLRDFIWCIGRYNSSSLKVFVDEFNPDIVFCPRKISPKLMRLEKLVSTMTKAPFVAFTGDDEASLNMQGLSLIAGFRKRYIHARFKKHVSLYSHYLMHSYDQAKEYSEEYRLTTSMLLKCGDFPESHTEKNVGNPIRMVYAGRLYCNRWVTLVEIGKALQIINKDGERMLLDIFTQEPLTRRQKKLFEAMKSINFRGPVSAEELKSVYKSSDIALHDESLDKKYREVTRVSFSTKIIDLLSCSCAVLAICWDKHAGYQYLHNNDAAFCISKYGDNLPCLQHICENPFLINEYSRKEHECGVRNNDPKRVRGGLLAVFNNVIMNHETSGIR